MSNNLGRLQKKASAHPQVKAFEKKIADLEKKRNAIRKEAATKATKINTEISKLKKQKAAKRKTVLAGITASDLKHLKRSMKKTGKRLVHGYATAKRKKK